jgi:hypothetical protein
MLVLEYPVLFLVRNGLSSIKRLNTDSYSVENTNFFVSFDKDN